MERHTFFGDPTAVVWRHDTTDVTTFDGWRTQNGFADPDTYADSAPTGVKIIVYNWAQQSTVSVDVSVILNMGERYVVQNSQDFYGPPIAGGVYTGRPLQLPMVSITPPSPVGVVTAQPAPVTGPTFNVFVLMKTRPDRCASPQRRGRGRCCCELRVEGSCRPGERLPRT